MEEYTTLVALRKEFIESYKREKLESLTIEEYALNGQNHSKDNFCYWVETRLRGLGSINGATSFKFGTYFGRTKADPTLKWRWASWTNESFDTIRNALISLYDAGEHEDIEAIKRNPISPMLKGKILSLYFPNRYLNIFAKRHLHHFLNKLSILHEENENLVDLREELIKYKNDNPTFANMTAIEFGHELYSKYGKPISEEEVQRELAEELYEHSQKEVISSSFKNVPEYSDSPEARPEQISTSYGQVYRIDPAKSRRAIIDAGYSCEANKTHESFIRKDGVNTYTEAHHLIPRSFQKEFENSLDVPANIISLCSNCHNCLHHGIDFELILKKLFDERTERLKAVDLNISYERLKGYY